MQLLSRRTLLTAGALGTVTSVVGARAAATAPDGTEVTLYRLDPDWGFPLTTDTGSSTKTRCDGNACHAAAPHRFFLTAADAMAGRLHRCCLAQPEAITVCIDLNALMPYYVARHGGVDGRCPELPEALRTALYAAAVCSAAQTTTSTTSSTTVAPAATPPGGDDSGATTTVPGSTVVIAGELPATR